MVSTICSVYQMLVRTNDEREGWHNRFNTRGFPQMNLFMLISLLFDETCLVPTQVGLVSDGKLKRCQCRASRDMEAKIHKLWSQYEDGEKSALQLLRAASCLYGPRVYRRNIQMKCICIINKCKSNETAVVMLINFPTFTCINSSCKYNTMKTKPPQIDLIAIMIIYLRSNFTLLFI